MGASTPVSKDSPRWHAWEAYAQTEDYANTKRWAVHAEHTEGSLWAAFEHGFEAATPTPARSEAAGGEVADGEASFRFWLAGRTDAELIAHMRDKRVGSDAFHHALANRLEHALQQLAAAREESAQLLRTAEDAQVALGRCAEERDDAREDAAEARRLVTAMCVEVKHERIGKFGVLEKHIEALAVWHGATEPERARTSGRTGGEGDEQC